MDTMDVGYYFSPLNPQWYRVNTALGLVSLLTLDQKLL
jgi:hypothetical protein